MHAIERIVILDKKNSLSKNIVYKERKYKFERTSELDKIYLHY